MSRSTNFAFDTWGGERKRSVSPISREFTGKALLTAMAPSIYENGEKVPPGVLG